MTVPVRVATYTRVASRRDRSELARRHRRVAAAFSDAGVTVRALHQGHRRLIAAGTAAAIVRLIGG